MKAGKPTIFKDKHWRRVKARMERVLLDMLYKPLFDTLQAPVKELSNSKDDLEDAIRKGRIEFDGKKFTGKFSASTSRTLKALGAKFDSRLKVWRLNKSLVPVYIQTAASTARALFKDMQLDFMDVLDGFDNKGFGEELKLKQIYGTIVKEINAEIKRDIKSLAVLPEITEDALNNLAADWGRNLELHIQGWTKDNIIKLRELALKNAGAGNRHENLTKILQDSFGKSRTKSEFLARQETSLLMASLRHSRYADAGITKYRWSTSKDERTRDDHKHLDGEIFLYDNPPITNRKTGARNSPGEDFGCRCIDIPIIE